MVKVNVYSTIKLRNVRYRATTVIIITSVAKFEIKTRAAIVHTCRNKIVCTDYICYMRKDVLSTYTYAQTHF